MRRRKDGSELVIGRNAVVEALRAGVPGTRPARAAVPRLRRPRHASRSSSPPRRGLPLLEATRAELDKLTDGAIHQGLALAVPAYDYADPLDLLEIAAEAGEPPLIVALDGITDPRNLGAIVRSAAAFGAHGVVVPERRAAGMTASAWKTSAGAAARVPVARATNLNRALKAYADAGCMIVGLAAEGTSLDDLDPEISRRAGRRRGRQRGRRALAPGRARPATSPSASR